LYFHYAADGVYQAQTGSTHILCLLLHTYVRETETKSYKSYRPTDEVHWKSFPTLEWLILPSNSICG